MVVTLNYAQRKVGNINFSHHVVMNSYHFNKIENLTVAGG